MDQNTDMINSLCFQKLTDIISSFDRGLLKQTITFGKFTPAEVKKNVDLMTNEELMEEAVIEQYCRNFVNMMMVINLSVKHVSFTATEKYTLTQNLINKGFFPEKALQSIIDRLSKFMHTRCSVGAETDFIMSFLKYRYRFECDTQPESNSGDTYFEKLKETYSSVFSDNSAVVNYMNITCVLSGLIMVCMKPGLKPEELDSAEEMVGDFITICKYLGDENLQRFLTNYNNPYNHQQQYPHQPLGNHNPMSGLNLFNGMTQPIMPPMFFGNPQTESPFMICTAIITYAIKQLELSGRVVNFNTDCPGSVVSSRIKSRW